MSRPSAVSSPSGRPPPRRPNPDTLRKSSRAGRGAGRRPRRRRGEKSALLGLASDHGTLQPPPHVLTSIAGQWSEFYPRVHPRDARWGQVFVSGEPRSPGHLRSGRAPLAWARQLQLRATRGGGLQEAVRAPGQGPCVSCFPKLLSRPIRCALNLHSLIHSFIHIWPSLLRGTGPRAGNLTYLIPALN